MQRSRDHPRWKTAGTRLSATRNALAENLSALIVRIGAIIGF